MPTLAFPDTLGVMSDMKKAFLTVVLLGMAGLANAHPTWLERSGNSVKALTGHQFPTAEEVVPEKNIEYLSCQAQSCIFKSITRTVTLGPVLAKNHFVENGVSKELVSAAVAAKPFKERYVKFAQTGVLLPDQLFAAGQEIVLVSMDPGSKPVLLANKKPLPLHPYYIWAADLPFPVKALTDIDGRLTTMYTAPKIMISSFTTRQLSDGSFDSRFFSATLDLGKN